MDAADQRLTDRDLDFFIREIKRIDNGSVGGPSQWTGHMLRVLTVDSQCMKSLMSLVCDIINGKVPAASRPFITASHLIALYKDDEHSNVRPIAIGEVIYRLASRIITREAILRAKPLLRNQHGIGEKNGTAQVVHQLQTCLADSSSPKAAITLDIRNAFNECSRKQMMTTVYSHNELDCIWKFVNFSYSAPTPLWTRDEIGQFHSTPGLQSKQGVRQGDPLSPLLFAVTWQKVIEKTKMEFKYDGVDILSYLDDTTIVAPIDTVFAVHDSIVANAREMGLYIQPSKCGFIYLHENTRPPSQLTTERIETHEIPRSDVITVLGTPVGVQGDDYAEVLRLRLDLQRPIFKRLLHPKLPKQMSFMLLRACIQQQLDYLLRVIPPSIMAPYADQFDSLVFDTAIDILGVNDIHEVNRPLNSFAREQLYLPIREGGCGLRRAADHKHIAFLSAHIASICDNQETWENIHVNYPHAHRLLMQIVTDCVKDTRHRVLTIPQDGDAVNKNFQQKQRQQFELLLPWAPAHDMDGIIDFPSLLRFFRKDGDHNSGTYHLQTSLTRLVNSSRLFALRHSKSNVMVQISQSIREGHTAHFNSLSNPHAGRWLYAIPRSGRTTLSDSFYICAMRTRLYLQGNTRRLNLCNCQSFVDRIGVYDDDPIHALSCPLTRSRQLSMRHDLVKIAIATALRRSGAVVELEPTNFDHDKNKRPDILAVINDVPTFIDVGIVNPAAKSHRQRKLLEAVNAYGRVKIAKYTRLVEDNDGIIIPFIVECSGGYGDHARYIVDDIKQLAGSQAAAYAPSDIIRDLLDEVAIAVQKGNALAIKRSFEATVLSNWRRGVSTAQARFVQESANEPSLSSQSTPAPSRLVQYMEQYHSDNRVGIYGQVLLGYTANNKDIGARSVSVTSSAIWQLFSSQSTPAPARLVQDAGQYNRPPHLRYPSFNIGEIYDHEPLNYTANDDDIETRSISVSSSATTIVVGA